MHNGMTELKKMKRRSLVMPPPTDASPNLSAPEIAPAAGDEVVGPSSPASVGRADTAVAAAAVAAEQHRVEVIGDGGVARPEPPVRESVKPPRVRNDVQKRDRYDARKHKRTVRTTQLSTRVEPQIYEQYRKVGRREGLFLSELLGAAISVYDEISKLASAKNMSAQEYVRTLPKE